MTTRVKGLRDYTEPATCSQLYFERGRAEAPTSVSPRASSVKLLSCPTRERLIGATKRVLRNVVPDPTL